MGHSSPDHLPLTPVAFEVLIALADGARHGYAIMQEIEERGDVPIRPGTLYRAINRLVNEGLVEEADSPSSELDERRRYYVLTGRGREAATVEARRLEAQVAAARAKRLLGRQA